MSESPKPTVLLLFGDDRLAIEERLADLRGRLGDPASAAGNLARFSITRLDLPALGTHLLAMPFLAARRMAVLDLADLPGKRNEAEERLLPLLETLPTTSILVGIRHVAYDEVDRLLRRGRRPPSSRTLANLHADASPLFRWILDNPDRGMAREHRTPRGAAFERWLVKRALFLGGEIDPAAAALLREWTAEETLSADQELRKLIAYAGPSRPVARADVERLTPLHAEADVFAMVDALGGGDGTQAIAHLRRLLEEEDARYLFAMIVRQFRLLLLARFALDHGQPPDQVLGKAPHRLPGFIAERVARQALRFSPESLKSIYGELFALDVASKTGSADLAVGLETLVAALAR